MHILTFFRHIYFHLPTAIYSTLTLPHILQVNQSSKNEKRIFSNCNCKKRSYLKKCATEIFKYSNPGYIWNNLPAPTESSESSANILWFQFPQNFYNFLLPHLYFSLIHFIFVSQTKSMFSFKFEFKEFKWFLIQNRVKILSLNNNAAPIFNSD